MKQINLDKHLKARDIYPTWKGYIKSARKSITIFSPFFDSLLLKLLKYNKHVPTDNITVITNFKVDNLIENYGQLKTIKTLLDKGIPVLSIDPIHAKILLIDGQHVVIGSQNFTNQGRRNREASIALSDSVENTKFLKILQRWEDEADPVEEELVELAIKHLNHIAKEHDEIIRKAKQEFDSVIKEHERQKERERLRKLEALRKRSSIQFAHGPIYANVRKIFSDIDIYDSLLADWGYDMTQWVTIYKNGRKQPYDLDRLHMFPMLLLDSLRMGFARIGKTRITYIRNSISWSNKRLKVGDYSLKVDITFPLTDTKKRNITIDLSSGWAGKCEFQVLFDGTKDYKIVRKRFFKECQSDFRKTLRTDFFSRRDKLNSFFKEFFTHFTYAELGIYRKNVKQYFDGDRYRLDLIRLMKNPILLARKI